LKKKITLSLIPVLGVIALTFVSCTASITKTTSASTTIAGPAVLTVVEANQTKTYSLADLQSLPAVSGYGGQIAPDNSINGPYTYQGVALTTLLNAVGGITEAQSVKITGSDNYSETLSYQQVTAENFTLYDSSTGLQSAAAEMTPQVFVAYEKDGVMLAADSGPFEFGIMTCQKRVTQSSLWVKKLIKIEVVAAQ
jgi:DMSO/TMAO reductase YedYZ molybdopterin-dependent catalytic subunit